jgi:hypothetical protein
LAVFTPFNILANNFLPLKTALGYKEYKLNIVKVISAILVSLVLSSHANAEVNCKGTIEQVYKWHNMDRISILLSTTNKWINMPTKSDEAMALMAFASNKQVHIYWSSSDITKCMDGWSHNRALEGYFVVHK